MTAFEAALLIWAIVATLGCLAFIVVMGREIERLRDVRDAAITDATDFAGPLVRYYNALTAIAAATRNGKSGTAKRVYRMAQEGLSDD